ncbi:hypothetical protein ACHAW5_003620 [Stephanodiscus triporus]|uniref:Mitochondrial fission process protein 1 n=1 Tax=Stephanodiscus triporus TaxID=2934178 RepID=A0ABD3PA06_9STRA
MTNNSNVCPPPAEDGPTTATTSRTTTTTAPLDDPVDYHGVSSSVGESASGIFRGIAASLRKAARAAGEARPLAFASEGAVAGDAVIPRWAYYGAWGLSGLAIGADVYNRYDDAPAETKSATALYWTAFHVPASLVVPAMIVHRVAHLAEGVARDPGGIARGWSPRARAFAPVAAAMISIVPVVPTVDYAAEAIMEPTLGRYLGLEFHHHDHRRRGGGGGGEDSASTEEDKGIPR